MKTNLNKVDYCDRNHSHLVYSTKQRCAGKQCPIPTRVLFQSSRPRARNALFPQLFYSKMPQAERVSYFHSCAIPKAAGAVLARRRCAIRPGDGACSGDGGRARARHHTELVRK